MLLSCFFLGIRELLIFLLWINKAVNGYTAESVIVLLSCSIYGNYC